MMLKEMRIEDLKSAQDEIRKTLEEINTEIRLREE